MKTQDITIVALMSALAVALTPLKISGTIGLDSIPAFLTLFIFRDHKAAYVAGLGHFLNALILGFPFTLVVHLVTAIGMFIMMILAQIILQHGNIYLAMLFIFLFNGLFLPLVISLGFNVATFPALVTMLAPTVLLNLVISYLFYLALQKRWQHD